MAKQEHIDIETAAREGTPKGPELLGRGDLEPREPTPLELAAETIAKLKLDIVIALKNIDSQADYIEELGQEVDKWKADCRSHVDNLTTAENDVEFYKQLLVTFNKLLEE